MNNVGQTEWNYLTHASLEKVKKGQLTIEEAEKLSQRLDKEAQQLCSNNPTGDACRTAISAQIQYIAMQEAWTVMQNDVSRTSKQTFDYLYNTPDANSRFVTYFNTIDNRANFFGASNQYEKNLGVGARWFGGADDVSRACWTGLGADGCLIGSHITFGAGKVFGNPHKTEQFINDTKQHIDSTEQFINETNQRIKQVKAQLKARNEQEKQAQTQKKAEPQKRRDDDFDFSF